ncbi:hypothetical protein [Streptomyces sp. NBC_00539]|uniref:hypothetical protein n=1 Tax=Streptomyces sp. NBC_00539 TaxID=2975770 RepID=UPI002E80AB03|nr:hypothetical protein [Streptomyces sp. NBC_00539]WUC62874.1 hypothetical protein OG861_00895 [Streptomyces sp. NBC_00539]
MRSLLGAASATGYGNLSGRGAQDQRQTALRMEQRLPSLFETITAEHELIVVETSGGARAVAGADAFRGGLAAGDPGLTGLIQAPVTDKTCCTCTSSRRTPITRTTWPTPRTSPRS